MHGQRRRARKPMRLGARWIEVDDDVRRVLSQLVTDAMGGQGAVREVCDMLLDCKMGLAQAVQSFLARVAREGPKGSPQ